MSAQQEDQPLESQLTIMRRVRPREVTQDANGNPKPISSAFLQGGPDGDVSALHPRDLMDDPQLQPGLLPPNSRLAAVPNQIPRTHRDREAGSENRVRCSRRAIN